MHSKRLKEETKHLHDRVEHVMHSSLLLSGQFTPDHYQNFLIKSHRYFCSITNELESEWPEYTLIISQKKEAISEDLKNLKISFVIENDNQPSNLGKFHNLGKIYIVLGAMLGNKMIFNSLKSNPLFSNSSFEYLTEHQENLGEIWSNFQNHINQLEEEQLEEVIEGAKAGYLLFGE